MWVNPMLTIWLWGTIFAVLLVGFSLWKWYWRDGATETDARGAAAGPAEGDPSTADDRR
jgi:hypothetical protein